MDLYLDSVDFNEIEQAMSFGFIKGLTTTPTFMHRHGITDIDGAITKLSGMVPELQVEALGESVDEILCSYLMFVWIEDPEVLADILAEFFRVLKPGGTARIYPLDDWHWFRFRNPELHDVLDQFTVSQSFVRGGGDWRVQPAMLTRLRKPVSA